MSAAGQSSERAVILAPSGRDATVASAILAEAGLGADICTSLDGLVRELERGAGAAVLTEDVLRSSNLAPLGAWIAGQPSWSDFPFVLLTRQGGGPERNPMALRLMELLGNVTFLERPFHPITLAAMVRMAVRGRRRQYEACARLDDLRRAREDAETAQLAAEMAARSKSHFLAVASHDLRQPVQSLVLFAGVLSAGTLREQERRAVDNIQRALGALKTLLDAILDISKLEAGIVAVERRDVLVGDLLEQIEAEYAARAAGRGLELRVVPSKAVLHTDSALLGQILRNLVENALRYTRQGHILVGCRHRREHLVICVSDTGIGIAADKQQEIFEEFIQVADSERNREQGLGLGLAIVRRLAGLLGHRITVRSTLGRGSTFTVEVPLAKSTDPQAARREPPPAPMAHGVRTVLLIDDDPTLLGGLAAMMAAWGQRVVTAGSYQQAMDHVQIRDIAPDLILADYRLQDSETGLDVIEGLRRQAGREIPAILLTGDTAPDVLRKAHAQRLQLLHKPILPSDLQQAIAHLWDG